MLKSFPGPQAEQGRRGFENAPANVGVSSIANLSVNQQLQRVPQNFLFSFVEICELTYKAV